MVVKVFTLTMIDDDVFVSKRLNAARTDQPMYHGIADSPCVTSLLYCYVLIAHDFGLFLNYRKAKVSHELFTTVEPMKEVTMITFSLDSNSKCFLQCVFFPVNRCPS